MKRKHRLAAWVARAIVLAGLAAMVAACSSGGGSGPGNAPVASLAANGTHGGQAGHASAGPPTTAQTDLDMIHFARCMRSHGVAMSDPFHRSGHTGLSINMPPQDAATRPAYAACNHFMQPIIQAKSAGGVGVLTPSRLAALTRYAECMRSRDIGMLDPTRSGELSLGNVPGITSDFGRYSPQFRAADTACQHFLPAGVQDNGTGP
jgi:hypothetical protein